MRFGGMADFLAGGDGGCMREKIEIILTGNEVFCQSVVDRVWELLMEDDFESEGRPRCGFTLISTIEPSEEVER